MISENKEQLQYKAFILHIILDMCSGCKKGREERSFVLSSAAAVSPHHIRWRLQAAALHDTQQNMKLVNWYVDKIQSVVQIQKYFNKILSSLLHQFQCDHDHNFSSYLLWTLVALLGLSDTFKA